jgi:hypothetical protein
MDGPKTAVKCRINPPGVLGTVAWMAEKGLQRAENATEGDEIVPEMFFL